MSDAPKDEAPEVETHEPPKTETHESPSEPEVVAEEKGEKVPAWGQSLIKEVQTLGESLNDVLGGIVGAPGGGPGPDETPQRKPWHKRNPLKD